MNARLVPTADVLVERLDGISREMDRRFNDMAVKLNKIDHELGEDYVTQKELMPIKVIVYTFAGCVLMAFLYLLIFRVGWSSQP